MPYKPIIAVTMGDPSGIGPEIILKALADPMIKRVARPLILGDWGVLQRTHVRRKRPKLICWQPGQRLLPMLDDPRAFTVCSLSALSARDSRPGVAAKIAGQALRYFGWRPARALESRRGHRPRAGQEYPHRCRYNYPATRIVAISAARPMRLLTALSCAWCGDRPILSPGGAHFEPEKSAKDFALTHAS